MEYGLRGHYVRNLNPKYHFVLILVLMEYGLRGDHKPIQLEDCGGLNPCFNGIWSTSLMTHDPSLAPDPS